ncbi:GntR family transcriptional regulator [Aminobacter sp. MSH1]|uniref:GntR family transcriptional regulator n=1 Tax=Aminobacter sp. MSH1 TaxID=374606 RepID=UPI00131F45AF|nr:GntR family transcriptional regulator [Aminobacter sp. MSH1]
MIDETEDSRTKRDKIVQELRRRILIGAYPRGARLRQDELAADFGVSITPVREALRVLESEGLAVSKPHKGVQVAGVDLARVEAIYVIRRLVESFAIRRATIRMSRKDLAEQKKLIEAMRGDRSEVETRALNRQFHFGFYSKCGMPELTAQIEVLWDSFPWDLLLGESDRAARSIEDHEAVLRSVEAGDVSAAGEALEKHIAAGFGAIRSALTPSPMEDPFDEVPGMFAIS